MDIQVPTRLLDGLVLASLSKEDLYGYLLTKKIQKKVVVSESTLYPVLRRLKKEAFLETYDKAFDGRNRRYYKLTETGFEELEKIRIEWRNFERGIDQVLGGEHD